MKRGEQGLVEGVERLVGVAAALGGRSRRASRGVARPSGLAMADGLGKIVFVGAPDQKVLGTYEATISVAEGRRLTTRGWEAIG